MLPWISTTLHGGASNDPRHAPRPPSRSTPKPSSADRGRSLRERRRSSRQESGVVAAAVRANVELCPVHVEVHHAGQLLNIGPAKVVLASDAESVRVSMTSGSAEASAPLAARARGSTRASVRSKWASSGGPISLRALGVEEHDMGLEDVDRAEVEVNGHATLSADGSSRPSSRVGRVCRHLSLYDPKLAVEPVRGLRLGLSGRTELTLDGSRVHFDDLEIAIGKVKLHARGEIERAEGHAKGTAPRRGSARRVRRHARRRFRRRSIRSCPGSR